MYNFWFINCLHSAIHHHCHPPLWLVSHCATLKQSESVKFFSLVKWIKASDANTTQNQKRFHPIRSICFGNFQNKTLISLNENGIHLHISNEFSIPNYNIQNFKEWKCWPQSQTLTNVILAVVQEGVRMRIHTTTQSDTCLKVPVKYQRFCFYIFLQVDLTLFS